MKTHGREIPIFLAIIATCAAASAQNLLSNPNFDTDLSSWHSEGATIAWDSQDADGSSSSGSAKIILPANSGPGGFLKPCTPLPAGASFSFGGKFLIPPGQIGTTTASLEINWYSGADCNNLVAFGPNTDAVTATGEWKTSRLDNVVPPAGTDHFDIEVQLYAGSHSGPSVTGYFDDAFLVPGSVTASCVASDTTLCLNGGRYKVTARWRTHTDSGDGHAEALTSDTGTFWFFSSNNVELIAKVVSACVDPFNRYWVFAAGLTNVEVTITVVDTHSGEVRTYVNLLDQAFAPIQDTNAFASCP